VEARRVTQQGITFVRAPVTVPTVLRDYQSDAIDSAREALRKQRAALIVLPTGAGKTVVFAEIARAVVAKGGRVLVLAHRSELLDQANAKIVAAAPDLRVEREQAESRARLAPIVVASVQSLSRPSRLHRFAPDHFALVVVDEAHHATAASYQRILERFSHAKVLGFTATPDRSDGIGLRSTFPEIAYQRSMLDLVRAGHLVPIRGRTVRVEAFDVNHVRVVAGDLQDKGLAEALEAPGLLDAIARSLAADSEGRSTLAFLPSVALAHRLSDLLNDLEPGSAVAIDGETPEDERVIRFAQFASGTKRFLANCAVATEGTDLPRCACVAVIRPTMSRALFTQMVGRGSRLFPGKVDCLVLNYAPSNAKHRLVLPVDVMLGDELDELTRQAIRELAELHPDAGVDELFARADELQAERRHTESRVASVRSTLEKWDPYGLIAIDEPARGRDVPPAERDEAASFCIDAGVPPDVIAKLIPVQIVAIARSLRNRKAQGLCSLKQARLLLKYGLNPNVTPKQYTRAFMAIKGARWRVPHALRNERVYQLPTEAAE
jgi:superfamily II DNA or RNA helicase